MRKIENIRHSLAHLLAASVRALYSGAMNAIGPAIENGFYQDFELPKPISEDDLLKIEAKMRELLPRWTKWTKKVVTLKEVKKEFGWNRYKLELAKEFARDKKTLTFYTCGGFIDLCKGGHAIALSEIDPESFKLDRVAGAYWRGNEKNKMLTRIYGLAFETKKELDAHLKIREEAEKRDHRKLGKELDIFTTSELVGAGLPLFTPRGALLREILEEYIDKLNKKYGYQKVWIPHIAKPELYKVSGHWEKFKDDLFHVKGGDDEFALKPMNCPHHTQIYAGRPRSYRDLPIRYFETTTVYRNEQSGELGGLTRVRSITQDDGHTFLREDQIEEEFSRLLEMQANVLGAVGFGDYWIRLSLRDPKNKKAYLGNDQVWQKSQKIMADILEKKKIEFKSAKGEAAFYGPKMDLMIKDSLSREWQVSTIQLDFNMPKRFGLTYVDERGKKQTPVMIHRAFMGATERFMGILIEHYAGAFPFWLSPVQVIVLSINEKIENYAHKVLKELKNKNIRTEADFRNESIGKKIREAELQKIPYLLIIGEKEAAAGKIAVRARGQGDLGQKTLEEFLKIAK